VRHQLADTGNSYGGSVLNDSISNPQWSKNGLWFAIAGLTIVLLGVGGYTLLRGSGAHEQKARTAVKIHQVVFSEE